MNNSVTGFGARFFNVMIPTGEGGTGDFIGNTLRESVRAKPQDRAWHELVMLAPSYVDHDPFQASDNRQADARQSRDRLR